MTTQANNFFYNGQRTEISISADGDFVEMKKMETLPKRPIGGYAVL